MKVSATENRDAAEITACRFSVKEIEWKEKRLPQATLDLQSLIIILLLPSAPSSPPTTATKREREREETEERRKCVTHTHSYFLSWLSLDLVSCRGTGMWSRLSTCPSRIILSRKERMFIGMVRADSIFAILLLLWPLLFFLSLLLLMLVSDTELRVVLWYLITLKLSS